MNIPASEELVGDEEVETSSAEAVDDLIETATGKVITSECRTKRRHESSTQPTTPISPVNAQTPPSHSVSYEDTVSRSPRVKPHMLSTSHLESVEMETRGPQLQSPNSVSSTIESIAY